MADWSKQLMFEDVTVGDEVPSIQLPLSIDRLVMEAGANRGFEGSHYDNDVARGFGAPAAFANTWYIIGLTERMLREWMGLKGDILRVGPFRMNRFNCAGTVTECCGVVTGKREEDGKHLVDLDVWQDDGSGHTMQGKATVALPSKEA